MLKYVLLGILNYSSLTGYDIEQFMSDATANFWYADLSQIYKTLKSLESEGSITSVTQPQDKRPDRRIYTITEQGHSLLQAWLMTPLTETTPMKEILLLKLFFSGGIDRAFLLAQLRFQRQLHVQTLAKYNEHTVQDIRQNAAKLNAAPSDILMWDVTRRAGILYEEMYLRWIDETIERLATGDDRGDT
jgi:PadR family transcriptional regulator, regulatory protein AphA